MTKTIPFKDAINFFTNALNKRELKKAGIDAGRDLSRLAKSRIDRGVDPCNKKFIPNAPFTIAAKGSSRPLIDTAVMKRSYFPVVTKDTLSIFNRKPYAVNHQFGIDVPQRMVLDAKVDAQVVLDRYEQLFSQSHG